MTTITLSLASTAPATETLAADRLNAIHERYGRWIRSSLRARFPREWEDLAQEVLVRLGGSLGQLRDERDEAVRAWVSKALRSVGVDAVRRRLRRPAVAAVAAEEVPAGDVSVTTRAVDREEHRHLLALRLRALSPRERQILALRFEDGLSFREIGERLGAPQGSVAGWYSRALVRLKSAL